MSDLKPEGELRVLIAASGTGGHLFPAIYIARAFQRLVPGAHVEFVGSGRPLEAKLLDQRGYRRHVVGPGEGIRHRGIGGLAAFVARVPAALLRANALLAEFRPNVVVGAGGYASVVPLLVAWLRRIPTWVHEAEPQPGLANRLLATFATRVSVAFEGTNLNRTRGLVVTGHPVREEMRGVDFGESAHPRHLLVIGGSQGARSIDMAMAELAPELAGRELQIRHQTRPENVEVVAERYRSAGIDALVVPFIDDIVDAYRWCDVIVSRAGAGSVMEIGVVNKPSVLVPLPAKGIGQSANAQVLGRDGKALVVEEGPEFSARLRIAVLDLLDPDRYRAMLKARGPTRPVDAADAIAGGCLELVRRNSGIR